MLFDEQRRFITDCLVIDVSKHGFRLRIQGERMLPRLVVVFDERTNRTFPAELRWQRNGNIGLYVQGGTD